MAAVGPNAIQTREQLIQALAVGAELEHGLCLQYLFTAFSLKDDIREGLTARELTLVRKWKANIFLIAAQEMLHLAQAGNLSTAIGGTMHLRRPNFPQSHDYYPTKLAWGLFPFSRETIRVYACYERPVEMSKEAFRIVGPCEHTGDLEARLAHEPVDRWRAKQPFGFLPLRYQPLLPRASRAETIGELYATIREAYETLRPASGELLIGNPALQVEGRLIDFPQVLEIGSRGAATDAIDLIIRQGEGAPADRTDSHFGVFVDILREYDELAGQNLRFSPARDVHPNPLSRLHVDNTFPGWRLIHDEYTRQVNDVCTGVYETMLMMLYRLYATPQWAEEQRKQLAGCALRAMTTAIKPLGEALTRLPMGDDGTPRANQRSTMAGPSFEINRALELVPDAGAAWVCIYERLLELATMAGRLADDPLAATPDHQVAIPYLRNAAVVLGAITQSFGAAPKVSPQPHR